MASASHPSHGSSTHSSNVVGVHYRVGKKIGEGSFGVIFEGQNLLNNQQVAIKFVSHPSPSSKRNFCFCFWAYLVSRNQGKAMHLNYGTNIGHTKY